MDTEHNSNSTVAGPGSSLHRAREEKGFSQEEVAQSLHLAPRQIIALENDDISGVGQTKAAHDLCVNIPDNMRHHYMQPAVGHYGVFNGSRWRSEIQPKLAKFIAHEEREAANRKGAKLAAE